MGRRGRGCFLVLFVVPGALFAVAGLAMTLYQVPPDPAALPLGPMFLGLGLIQFLVGLHLTSESTRARIVAIGLAVASGVALAATIALWLASMPTWWALPILAVLMVAGWVIARRHPDYVHAAEMAEIAPVPAEAATAQAAHDAIPLTTSAGRAGCLSFRARVGRGELRRAVRIVVCVTLGMTVISAGFGLVAAYQMQDVGGPGLRMSRHR